ncbi:hypothetical protein NE237_027591 [Protea cynaroides]|uniref:Uncharacterized protein n=1 Tax=Protea cynaroides TaxID=273540 RepID=A0A9Q0GNU3_9MAGN|nr:hypothetical protein NE237_027591 [Protea cynaroides]
MLDYHGCIDYNDYCYERLYRHYRCAPSNPVHPSSPPPTPVSLSPPPPAQPVYPSSPPPTPVSPPLPLPPPLRPQPRPRPPTQPVHPPSHGCSPPPVWHHSNNTESNQD